jgi:hypothetical protein
LRIADCGLRIDFGFWIVAGLSSLQPQRPAFNQQSIRNPKSAFRNVLRRVRRARRGPGSTSRDPFQRAPAAADDAVARDHRFRVSTAGWREAAAQADASRGAGEGVLIDVNGAERERLRLPCEDADDEERNRARNDPRNG